MESFFILTVAITAVSVASLTLSRSIGKILSNTILGIPKVIGDLLTAFNGVKKLFINQNKTTITHKSTNRSSADVWSPSGAINSAKNLAQDVVKATTPFLVEEVDLTSPAFLRAGVPASYFSEEEEASRIAAQLKKEQAVRKRQDTIKAKELKKAKAQTKRKATLKANRQASSLEEERKVEAMVKGEQFNPVRHSKEARDKYSSRFANFESVMVAK
ncbi:hypothetical protein [Vibrio crassostreae]|uniref:hypothetical protein n=1 Tax=Vibrio crassostreae TaxID=246167 RepID=UPI001B304DBD|nr:hypothetical protein [Vibrio crassostreae]